MKPRPATPLATRLRLAAAEVGASFGETGLTALMGAAAPVYGAALVGSDPSLPRMAAGAAFAATGVLLGRLSGVDARAVVDRGLLRAGERAAACVALGLFLALALASIDPALLAFAAAFLASLRAPDLARAILTVGLAAFTAISVGFIGSEAEPSALALGLWIAAGAAIAAPLALGLDVARLPRRAPALAAALTLGAPVVCVAALAREAPAGAPLAVAGFAFLGSVQAASAALGRSSPRQAALAARAYAVVGALALATAGLA